MNRKILVAASFVAALAVVIGVFAVSQLPQGGVGVVSASGALSLDDVATLKADSFELYIRDVYSMGYTGYTFNRVGDRAGLSPSVTASLDNCTGVSRTVFLADLSAVGSTVVRVGNTFYLFADYRSIQVYYAP